MLNLKTNPTSIDYDIQNVQTALHAALMTAWSFDPLVAADNAKYQCYGRCYKNRKNNGSIAEVFIGDSTTGANDYKEVYWNDELSAISFFGISDKVDIANENKTEVHLVFFVDLEKLALKDFTAGAIKHRADEEIHNQVQMIIGKSIQGLQITSIETGLANVLRDYPGSYRDERLKVVDMHPRHCFRFNFIMEFDINSNCKPFKSF